MAFALRSFKTPDAALELAEVEYHPTRQEIAEVAERIAANAHRVDPYFQREAAQIPWETGTVHIPGPVKEAQNR